MAFQNTYPPMPMQYNGPPHSQSSYSVQAVQQQHLPQQVYPTSYPQSQPPTQSFPPPQPFPGQPGQAQAQTSQPAPNVGNNGGGQLSQPFKKPSLPVQRGTEPQQHYLNNAPPTNIQNIQEQAKVTQDTRQSPSNTSNQPTTISAPLAPSSSMTAQTASAPAASVSPPQPEPSSQPPESSPQVNKLSVLDQERVDALLNVNGLLFQEICILQKAGVKIAQNPQSPQQANPPNQNSPQLRTDDKANPNSTPNDGQIDQNPGSSSTNSTPTTTTPTTATHPPVSNPLAQKKYHEYMVRLKTNLSYLVTFSDPLKIKVRQPYPSLLDGPSAWIGEKSEGEEKERWEQLRDAYKTCRSLWPDWKPPSRIQPGLQQQQGQQKPSQQQAQLQAQHQQQQAQPQQQQQAAQAPIQQLQT